MSIQFHPDISTFISFSAGTLDEPFAAVIATHIDMCAVCQETVRRTDALGGALLDTQPDAALPDAALDKLMRALGGERIERSEPVTDVLGLPAPLRRYLPKGLDSVKWKFSGPGVATADLPSRGSGRSRLLLLKVGAGRRVPEHGHGGQELTLILTGAYRDRFGVFATGDLADHDEDVEHQPIAEPGEDCICLVAVDAKLTFRSRLIRTLQPLFGL